MKLYHDRRRNRKAILLARVDDWVEDTGLEDGDGRLKLFDALQVRFCFLVIVKSHTQDPEQHNQIPGEPTS